jgi:hypothetical protein
MNLYVKVAACLALMALLAVALADPCNCASPNQECNASGNGACCGCGTLQSQCTTCAEDHYCSYGDTPCQGGTVGYAFCCLKT